MASIKLENLEMWQDLNEHELEVIRGGDDKSASSNNQGNVPVTIQIKDWSIESKRRLYCALVSRLWHFC